MTCEMTAGSPRIEARKPSQGRRPLCYTVGGTEVESAAWIGAQLAKVSTRELTKDGFRKDFENVYTLLGDGGEKKAMLSAAGVGELHHPTSRGSNLVY